MFYPITTSSLVAHHDAWLAEMQKEPEPGAGRVARIGVRRGLPVRLGHWLVSAGLRLRERYTRETPPAPEAPVHSSEATAC